MSNMPKHTIEDIHVSLSMGLDLASNHVPFSERRREFQDKKIKLVSFWAPLPASTVAIKTGTLQG